MTEAVHFITDDTGRQSNLADVLTHQSPAIRLAGRAAASGWPEQCRSWFVAELDRGTSVDDALRTVFLMQVQIAASLVGCVLKSSGDSKACENYREILAREFVKQAAATRNYKGQKPS